MAGRSKSLLLLYTWLFVLIQTGSLSRNNININIRTRTGTWSLYTRYATPSRVYTCTTNEYYYVCDDSTEGLPYVLLLIRLKEASLLLRSPTRKIERRKSGVCGAKECVSVCVLHINKPFFLLVDMQHTQCPR